MRVVSNSSALINLVRIGKLTLLRELFGVLIVMDESLGRETGQHLGLRYIGLIGALVMAKRRGLISAVKPHLDMLRDIAGFRVDAALYAHILKDQGETGV
jgi:predicted nucleic acid-binding protein